jgi:hypothetical protein
MKLVIVVLVVTLLLIGLPVSMGMGEMSYCPACLQPNPSLASVCLAVIALGFLIAGLGVVGRATLLQILPRPLQFAAVIDKPPRLV